MTKLGMLGTIAGAAILTAAPLSLQWSHTNVGLSLARAEAQERPLTATMQVSAEGRIAAHTVARLTQVLLATALDRTPAMDVRRPITGYLTEQAPLHLGASTPAATL